MNELYIGYHRSCDNSRRCNIYNVWVIQMILLLCFALFVGGCDKTEKSFVQFPRTKEEAIKQGYVKPNDEIHLVFDEENKPDSTMYFMYGSPPSWRGNYEKHEGDWEAIRIERNGKKVWSMIIRDNTILIRGNERLTIKALNEIKEAQE